MDTHNNYWKLALLRSYCANAIFTNIRKTRLLYSDAHTNCAGLSVHSYFGLAVTISREAHSIDILAAFDSFDVELNVDNADVYQLSTRSAGRQRHANDE